MEPGNSWRTCLESTQLLSVVEDRFRFMPTNQSLHTENSKTNGRQGNDGIVDASFDLDGLDMQLGVVYWA